MTFEFHRDYMNTEKYIKDLKDKLLDTKNWKSITMSRTWTSKFPTDAGVYALKENRKVVYVGETGNLRGRMNDLLDSRHHTVRRTIGERYFSKAKGFKKATVKKKFPDKIEKKVNKYICDNLKIACLEVPLGRKELEEFIEAGIPKELRLNKRGKRKKK